MMALFFLLCWTALFLGVLFLIWLKIVSRIRVYLLFLLNLIFLTGVFYIFPMWMDNL